jgi:zinc/manganese transport system substrate-binding protein
VLTSHDAFGYFGRAYGVTFLAPQGLSSESEASAAQVAELINRLKPTASIPGLWKTSSIRVW